MHKCLSFLIAAIASVWMTMPSVALATSEEELRHNNVLTIESINAHKEAKTITLCYYGWDYESEPDGKLGPTWPLGEETYQFEAGQAMSQDWIEDYIQHYDGWVYFEYLVLDYDKNDVRIEYNYYRETLVDPRATMDLVLDTIEFIKTGDNDASYLEDAEEYEEIGSTEMTAEDAEKANILIDKLNEEDVAEEERVEAALILEAIEDGRYDFRNETIIDSDTTPSLISGKESNSFLHVVPFVSLGAVFLIGILIYVYLKKSRL